MLITDDTIDETARQLCINITHTTISDNIRDILFKTAPKIATSTSITTNMVLNNLCRHSTLDWSLKEVYSSLVRSCWTTNQEDVRLQGSTGAPSPTRL